MKIEKAENFNNGNTSFSFFKLLILFVKLFLLSPEDFPPDEVFTASQTKSLGSSPSQWISYGTYPKNR